MDNQRDINSSLKKQRTNTKVSELNQLRRRVAALEQLETEREQNQKLQQALYKIADTTSAAGNMAEFYQALHQIVEGLMYAKNFYIVVFEEDGKSARFIYFVDSVDSAQPDLEGAIPTEAFKKNLTNWVFQTRLPLLADAKKLAQMYKKGQVVADGPLPVEWLGVPLMLGDDLLGAMVVQSYNEAFRYSKQDQHFLAFAANHIAIAITRKRAEQAALDSRAALEQRVEQRTKALKTSNRKLEQEVEKRKSAEHLQSALYRIAQLTNTAHDLNDFYQAIHAIIGELMYAVNFYIAAFNAGLSQLEFVYFVDEKDSGLAPRIIVKHKPQEEMSATEQVFTNGVALLYTSEAVVQYFKNNNRQARGHPPHAWLGVPLHSKGQRLGVLVVQSYNPAFNYNQSDKELLTFVAQHVATALLRKQDTDALRDAHKSLGKRVEELKKTQKQLVLQEKMASLGTLTAGVAHEINNPANFTQAAVYMMKDEIKEIKAFLIRLAGGDEADEDILQSFEDRFSKLLKLTETATEGTQRIQTIVDNLRTFTHLDQAEHQLLAIAGPIESTVRLVKTRNKAIDIITQLDFNPKIRCYPAKLCQVIMNLLVNACQAIEVRQQQHKHLKGQIIIHAKQVGKYIRISFKDNGCGMEQSTQQKIFEPFFTTKAVGRGTGLGMSISYGIIEEHNGRIEVNSEVGSGSCITLDLPLAPANAIER